MPRPLLGHAAYDLRTSTGASSESFPSSPSKQPHLSSAALRDAESQNGFHWIASAHPQG